MKTNPYQALEEQGIAPVISLKDAGKAIPLAQALSDGGVTNIEITLRTSAALEAIRRIKDEMPRMTVSAGTCLTQRNVDEAIEAGADFVVSPGYNEKLVQYCLSSKIGIIPGCVTASEIDLGVQNGLKYFKYFPAESLGGLKAIELLCGPYRGIRFMPTGGMTYSNIGSYLASKYVLACGGSYMAGSALIEAGNFAQITENTRRAVDLSLGFSLAHVGINNDGAEAAQSVCRCIADIFRLPVKMGNSSDFSGTYVECMKTMYYGKNGHIGFHTNSVERALAYFRQKGLEIRPESYKSDENGVGKFFYLKDEVGGFALHVVR